MPSLEQHAKLSLKRTGSEFREVHEWMDGKSLGIKERLERHDILKIPEFLPLAEKQFGKEGAREYLQHIKDDYNKDLLLALFEKAKKLKFW